VRRPHSARAHSMQAATAARRARRHPHRRSAAPRQRWPRVRAARRTKEHKLQVDGLHRSPHSGRTGSASATWWLLRRQCRATRSAGWRGRRPTTGGTACPATSGAAKTENACTFGAAPLQGCKAHGTRSPPPTCCRQEGATKQCASVAAKVRTPTCCPWRRRWGRRPCALPARCTAASHAAFAPRQLCRGSGAAQQSGAESAHWLGSGRRAVGLWKRGACAQHRTIRPPLALAAPHLLPPRACRTKVTGTELEKRIAEACSNKVSGAIGRRGQTWP
jgi:hypothetical protein